MFEEVECLRKWWVWWYFCVHHYSLHSQVEMIINSGDYYYGEYSIKTINKRAIMQWKICVKNSWFMFDLPYPTKYLTQIQKQLNQWNLSFKLILSALSKIFRKLKTPVSGKSMSSSISREQTFWRTFNERKMQIRDIYQQALKMENDGNIGSCFEILLFCHDFDEFSAWRTHWI